MATETLVPTGTISQTGWNTWALSNVDTDDTTWQDPTDNTTSPDCRLSFNTPSGTLTQGATDQAFNVKARKFETGQTGTPTIRIELWETGGGSSLAASSELNLTGSEQTFTLNWDADLLSNLDGSGCEIYVWITKAGGPPGARASGSIQYIDWVASYVSEDVDGADYLFLNDAARVY